MVATEVKWALIGLGVVGAVTATVIIVRNNRAEDELETIDEQQMGDFESRPEGSEGEMGGRPRPDCEEGEECGPPPCEDGEECLGPPPGEREMGGLQSVNRLMNLSNESTLTSL